MGGGGRRLGTGDGEIAEAALRGSWILLALLLFAAPPALAATPAAAAVPEPEPFTTAAFAAAQASGRPILVGFDAAWCSTCTSQRPAVQSILEELHHEPGLRGLAVLVVDFDAQKELVQQFGVQMQSTLIAFRGATEIGRSVGETDPAAIKALLLRAPAPAGANLLAAGSYLLALLAGVLSTLSPCVLPLLPIVVAGAAAAHRWGAAALVAGVALSFAVTGLFVATIGLGLGLDGDLLRRTAAALMVAVGLVLASRHLQEWFAVAAGPLGAGADRLSRRVAMTGLGGQLVIGLSLGVVWTPCAGPTLGAAVTLAAQRQDLGEAAALMALYGIGAALPLALLGFASREALVRWRGRMGTIGHGARIALGLLLVAIGGAVLIGLDRSLEAALVRISPLWLERLAARF